MILDFLKVDTSSKQLKLHVFVEFSSILIIENFQSVLLKKVLSGAIVCVYNNRFLGPDNITIASISFHLGFILVKNVDVHTWDMTMQNRLWKNFKLRHHI